MTSQWDPALHFAKIKEELADAERKIQQLRSQLGAIKHAGSSASLVQDGTSASSEEEASHSAALSAPILGGTQNAFSTRTELSSQDFTTLVLSSQSTRTDSVTLIVESAAGHAIVGSTPNNNGYGIGGFGGTGVLAEGGNGPGLFATSVNSNAIEASASASGTAAVSATNTAAVGENFAVSALSTNGVGVLASGGQCQLGLVPSQKVGPPQSGSHFAGEFVLDANINLYLCKAAGTPGTWKLIG